MSLGGVTKVTRYSFAFKACRHVGEAARDSCIALWRHLVLASGNDNISNQQKSLFLTAVSSTVDAMSEEEKLLDQRSSKPIDLVWDRHMLTHSQGQVRLRHF